MKTQQQCFAGLMQSFAELVRFPPRPSPHGRGKLVPTGGPKGSHPRREGDIGGETSPALILRESGSLSFRENQATARLPHSPTNCTLLWSSAPCPLVQFVPEISLVQDQDGNVLKIDGDPLHIMARSYLSFCRYQHDTLGTPCSPSISIGFS